MILNEIARKTIQRIEEEKRRLPLAELKARIRELPRHRNMEHPFPFQEVLSKEGISFICEIKKASPSKGIIAEHFPYLEIAGEYERAGADAVSVLTEPFYFKGSGACLSQIRKRVGLPLLRKDFTVDEYMIYQAKELGADAVLLICALLSPAQLSEYRAIAEELGLSALVEAHDEREVETALRSGAGIVGVNNRDLRNFTVDIHNSLRLRKLVPPEVVFVSESGMKNRSDIERLEQHKIDAALIGESFMRSSDKTGMLRELRGR